MSDKKEKKVGLWKKAVLGLAFLTTTSAAMAQKTTVKHKKVNPTELSANALKRVKNAQCTVKITETEGNLDLAKLANNTSEIRKDFDFEKSAKIAQQLGFNGDMKAYRIGTNTAFVYNTDGFMLHNFETGQAVGLRANGEFKVGRADNYIISRKDADYVKHDGLFDMTYRTEFVHDLSSVDLAKDFDQPFTNKCLFGAYASEMGKSYKDQNSELLKGLMTYEKFSADAGHISENYGLSRKANSGKFER